MGGEGWREPEGLEAFGSVGVVVHQPGGGGPSASKGSVIVMRLDDRPHLAIMAALELPGAQSISAIFAAMSQGVSGGAEGAALAQIKTKPANSLVVDGAPGPFPAHNSMEVLFCFAL